MVELVTGSRQTWSLAMPASSSQRQTEKQRPVDGTCCAGQDFVNLIQASVLCEEGMSIEESPPSDWLVGKSVVHFLD